MILVQLNHIIRAYTTHFDTKFLYPRPNVTHFSSKILPLDGFAHPWTHPAKGTTGAPGSARHAGRECRDEPREINFSFIERGRRAMRVDDDDDGDGDGVDGRASDRARRASRVDHANGRRPQARWVQRCVRDDATRDARREEAKTLRGKYTHRSTRREHREARRRRVERAWWASKPLCDRYHLDRSIVLGRGPRQISVCVNRLKGAPPGWTGQSFAFCSRLARNFIHHFAETD